MEDDVRPVRYRHDYRRNDRCVYRSHEFAELLWRRIQPTAEALAVRVDPDLVHQHLAVETPLGECPEELRLGYGMEGIWRPVGLNETLRFCRYEAGGFFRRHCDGMFRRSEDEQSLFTCMFYLNGDLDGGATRFLKPGDGTLGSAPLEAARQEELLASVPPETGLCLLFYQKGLLHEGEDLHAGSKYILRTDVMFRRDPSTKPERSASEVEALDCAQRATAAEERGECDLACQLYRRAFKLNPRLERMF